MSKKKSMFVDPMADSEDNKAVSRAVMAKATNKESLMAGQYIRRTFTYPPSQLEAITQIAKELHMSENNIVRWFNDHMIQAYRQGLRPEIESSSVMVQPKLRVK